ncbi:hypothetical protein Y032_0589g375 [Ancylostoma ceylanicum]|uniref:Uncharacterized protein n=1 Tax=Ancylostoma ceylanicum TaxID=53326 RepID=A0A016WMU2_9BILA|nr:hypothetical protein Y032_0589g375 [Ancylostoma ceylanicum]
MLRGLGIGPETSDALFKKATVGRLHSTPPLDSPLRALRPQASRRVASRRISTRQVGTETAPAYTPGRGIILTEEISEA